MDDEKQKYLSSVVQLVNTVNTYDKEKLSDYIDDFRKNIYNYRGKLEDARNLMVRKQSYYYNRYYSRSWNIYSSLKYTLDAAVLLDSLIPTLALKPEYATLVNRVIGKRFIPEVNLRWEEETKPILEAYSHTIYMLNLVLTVDLDVSEESLGYGISILYPMYEPFWKRG
jgi:hypothetical protein